jgi:predicted alpha/beta superfamily hydrolase
MPLDARATESSAGAAPPPTVIKHEAFAGSLPTRALYVYLPPGYHDSDERYPVLYVHDGQNVFESYVQDSYSGSWRADESADRLIRAGAMRPCIIVGVANGNERRLSEYLPPYSRFHFAPHVRSGRRGHAVTIAGSADRTARYYSDEIAPFVAATYRTLAGRDHTATVGSSMGGLFSSYLAWERGDFARHHALLSPSFWITRDDEGRLEAVERMRIRPEHSVRLWLDSGTGISGIPGKDDDNRFVTEEARDALLGTGFELGPDFRYRLYPGARHHESAWGARLPEILPFLFPPDGATD